MTTDKNGDKNKIILGSLKLRPCFHQIFLAKTNFGRSEGNWKNDNKTSLFLLNR